MSPHCDIPDAPLIPIRCEPDYYGASLLIARALGMSAAPASSASWVHGCDMLPVPREVFSPHFNNPEQTHLVSNEAAAAWWRSRGMNRAIAVGCPFIYTPPSGASRMTNSVLAMPAHGLPGVLADELHAHSWLKTVAELKPRFANITVCLHRHDVPKLAPMVEALDMHWITGASHDSDSLPRIRSMFDQFEHVVTDSLGSHVPYAAWSGCKVCFLEPLQHRSWEQVRDLPHQKNHPEMEKNIRYHQKDSLLERVPFLFVDAVENACRPMEWAARALGVESMRPPEEVARLLGWRWSADEPAFQDMPYERAALLFGSPGNDPEALQAKAELKKCQSRLEEAKMALKSCRTENRVMTKRLEALESFAGSASGKIAKLIYSLEKRLRPKPVNSHSGDPVSKNSPRQPPEG